MKAPQRIVLGLLGLAHISLAVPVAPPPPEVLPAEAATAPRNTKIWVFTTNAFVQVFNALGVEVPTTTTSIAASFSDGLTKLTPVTQLAPGRYEVRTFETIATFTVTDELDTTAPGAPVVDVKTTGRVGQMMSTVTVTSADPGTFLVVLFDGQSWEASSVPAVTSRGTVTLFGLPAGEARLKVLRVDAAGNVSEPTEVVATVPADRSCSVAPVLPLSFLALALLHRRRRRVSESVGA